MLPRVSKCCNGKVLVLVKGSLVERLTLTGVIRGHAGSGKVY